jgi:hypothetical protein
LSLATAPAAAVPEQLGPFAQTRFAHASTISPPPTRDEYGRGSAAGDELDVTLELDTEPREVTVGSTSSRPSTPRHGDAGSSTACRIASKRWFRPVVSIERRKPLMA